MKEPSSEEKSRMRVDQNGDASSETDEKDALALSMLELQKRKRRGRIQKKDFSRETALQSHKPSAFVQYEQFHYFQDDQGGSQPIYRTAFSSDGSMHLEQDSETMNADLLRSRRSLRAEKPRPVKQIRLTRLFGLHRVVKAFCIVLVILAALLAGYRYILPLFVQKTEVIATRDVEISTSILDDAPAHVIRIPEAEGALIYIKELRKSYTVTGGYAVIEVPDYTWYETLPELKEEFVLATMTPYLKSSAGEQLPMEPITFEVYVPESPLILVSPDTGYAEVSTAYYNIQFRVEKNSTVEINNEDYSDLVNTQDGLISFNAPISPKGENVIRIKVKSQYYRETEKDVIIYREVQEIPLDLASTLSNRSISQTMKISATTLPGATITIESDYVNFDDSELSTKGIFSFEAVFTRVGTNTVKIRADYPGKSPSIVTYDVYYLPESRVYTAKAWPLDSAWDYSDLLSNISTRIANAQIYRCIGEITEILSDNPQLAIMEMGTETSSRTVLLENRSTDTWVVGERYRVYADVYGLYNSMPRLVGRYTYSP